jgi:hypothetical protein
MRGTRDDRAPVRQPFGRFSPEPHGHAPSVFQCLKCVDGATPPTPTPRRTRRWRWPRPRTGPSLQPTPAPTTLAWRDQPGTGTTALRCGEMRLCLPAPQASAGSGSPIHSQPETTRWQLLVGQTFHLDVFDTERSIRRARCLRVNHVAWRVRVDARTDLHARVCRRQYRQYRVRPVAATRERLN